MAHPHRIRDIARQAGLSEATVDRVLNHRPGVRAATVAEVRRAVAELDRQRDQLRLVGRTLMLDVVMNAPDRFSAAVRRALEAELPGLRPAVLRARFHLSESGGAEQVLTVLDRINRRATSGTRRPAAGQGVLLKAPDRPEIAAAVDRLTDAGIPVVTLVTDLSRSRRCAYVGMDNRAAGATAAYLISRFRSRGTILVTLSSSSFLGEEEREHGFRNTLADLAPGRAVREVTETAGPDAALRTLIARVLAADPSIDTVYSIGGGNAAILDAFGDCGRTPVCFVAHDLDVDNTALLRARRLSAVLHHDVRADMRRACRFVMRAHRMIPGPLSVAPSQIQVVTPFNEPAGLTAAVPLG